MPRTPLQIRLSRTTTAVIAGLALFETALIATVKVALSFIAMSLALVLIGVASLIGG